MEPEDAPSEPAQESSSPPEQPVAVTSVSAANDESDGRIYFKRYRGVTALLALFIIMVAVAFVLYPRRPAVYRPQPFTVKITATEELTTIAVVVEKLSAKKFGLIISLGADAPSLPVTQVFAETQLQLPAPVAAASCRLPNCASAVGGSGFFAGQNYYVTDYSGDFKPPPGMSTWAWNEAFIVDTSQFAFDENGLDVEMQLPVVQVSAKDGNPAIEIGYFLHNPGYDWTGGPSPSYGARQLGRLGWAVDWQLSANQLSNPVPVSGTDNNTAADDSYRTFASGALLGVAGGALVGAIQEATHSRWHRKAGTPGPSNADLPGGSGLAGGSGGLPCTKSSREPGSSRTILERAASERTRTPQCAREPHTRGRHPLSGEGAPSPGDGQRAG
jgi:hypothetical protein